MAEIWDTLSHSTEAFHILDTESVTEQPPSLSVKTLHKTSLLVSCSGNGPHGGWWSPNEASGCLGIPHLRQDYPNSNPGLVTEKAFWAPAVKLWFRSLCWGCPVCSKTLKEGRGLIQRATQIFCARLFLPKTRPQWKRLHSGRLFKSLERYSIH